VDIESEAEISWKSKSIDFEGKSPSLFYHYDDATSGQSLRTEDQPPT
jgi:hypothetical protein